MAHHFTKFRDYTTSASAANPALRELLLHHIDYLRKHPSTRSLNIDADKRSLDLYDLYRFLNNNGYPAELHYVILLINDIPSHTQFDTSVDFLLLPDPTVLEEIIATSGLG